MNIRRMLSVSIGALLVALTLSLAVAVPATPVTAAPVVEAGNTSLFTFCVIQRGITPFYADDFRDCVNDQGESYGWCMETLVPMGWQPSECADRYLRNVHSQCDIPRDNWDECVDEYYEVIIMEPIPLP